MIVNISSRCFKVLSATEPRSRYREFAVGIISQRARLELPATWPWRMDSRVSAFAPSDEHSQ